MSRRVSELGLRRTFGARTVDLLALIFKQGLHQLLLGMLVGGGLGLALSHLIKGLLYGVKPWDPLATTLVISIMLSTGLAASVIPALRAIRISPAEAIRYE